MAAGDNGSGEVGKSEVSVGTVGIIYKLGGRGGIIDSKIQTVLGDMEPVH